MVSLSTACLFVSLYPSSAFRHVVARPLDSRSQSDLFDSWPPIGMAASKCLLGLLVVALLSDGALALSLLHGMLF